jgi:hypothetical protein
MDTEDQREFRGHLRPERGAPMSGKRQNKGLPLRQIVISWLIHPALASLGNSLKIYAPQGGLSTL